MELHNVVAALRVARTLDHGVVVTILCDGAAKYLNDRFWDEPGVCAGEATCRRGLQGLQGRDLFGDRERAQLRFLFWLYHSGHPVP